MGGFRAFLLGDDPVSMASGEGVIISGVVLSRHVEHR